MPFIYNTSNKRQKWRYYSVRTKTKFVSLVAVVSFAMAVIRTVIIQYDMEKNGIENETYYLPDNVEVSVFTVASVLFAALFVFCAFYFGRKQNVTLCRSYGAVPAGSLTLAFALIGAAAVYIATVVRNGSESVTVIGIMILVTTLLSAVKFVISGIRYDKTLKSTYHALAAIAPIALCMLRLLGDFIRSSAAPLASSGAYHIVGLSAALIYFLTEGKTYVVKTSGSIFYAFGYLSVFFLLIYSVPNLFMHCFGFFRFDYYAAYSVVDIGLAVYILTRLSSAKLDEKCEEIRVEIESVTVD